MAVFVYKGKYIAEDPVIAKPIETCGNNDLVSGWGYLFRKYLGDIIGGAWKIFGGILGRFLEGNLRAFSGNIAYKIQYTNL